MTLIFFTNKKLDNLSLSLSPLTKNFTNLPNTLLWYGFLYYSVLLLLSLTFFALSVKQTYTTSLIGFSLNSFFLKHLLSLFLFLFLLHFWLIYQLLENSLDFCLFVGSIKLFEVSNLDALFYLLSPSVTLLKTYYFPFIFIFIFITFLSIFFCLSYNFSEFNLFMFYCVIVLMAGYTLFFTDSLIIFFFAYEFLLVPSFFILYKFAKTRRCIEAAYLMFFWTQFGAFFLIFSFLYLFFITQSTFFSTISLYCFTVFDVNFLFVCWFIGFGVKLPIWPFYGWLPKAHVEASTNFSIFLSGVLVKFAFFGLFKCLLTVQLEPTFVYVYPILLIGMTDSVFKLFYQIDLKKLVAYSTVVEMHWLTICIVSGQSCLMLAGFCMLISHALLSTNSFLLVDAINRRFKTRLITEISGINFLCPKLFLLSLINCLIFLGFPGSIFFIAEFLFFSYFWDLFPFLSLILIVFLYLLGPTFFFRSWVNVLFGLSSAFSKTLPLDLTSKELLLFINLISLIFWLGFSWQSFIF